jgi:molybdopterin-guanine dinucleotide biosynthesis protein A
MSPEPATPPAMATVLVLAGGTSRRFGTDKLGAPLGGSTVLDTALASVPAGWPVVAVGPARPCTRTVSWTREDPAGGGPLAGVAAGLDLVGSDLVAVLAGDMPYAGVALGELVAALRSAPPEVSAVVGRDDQGVPNPLLAAYRTDAVRRLLSAGGTADRPARALLALPHTELAVHGRAARGVDTAADLDRLADET